MGSGGFAYESIYFDEPINEGRVMDVFLPDGAARGISILFIHGGGWFGGTRTRYHALMRAFNAEGFVCASSDYRLGAGRGSLQDKLTDLRHAYDIFTQKLRSMELPGRIMVFGSSAGAHLAALLSFAEPGACGENLEYRGRKLSADWAKPAGTVLQAAPFVFEPWEDVFPQAWAAMEKLIGEPYSSHPELYAKASPIAYVNSSACPTLYMHAENEHMFPLCHFLEFKEKMDKAGVRCEYKSYTNAEHGFFYDLTRRQQREAFADMLAFIENFD